MVGNKKIELKLFSEENIKSHFDNRLNIAIDLVKEAFFTQRDNNVISPKKLSQIFDEENQNRINFLPATLKKERVTGFKWVSVFPSNQKQDLLNLTGITVLSSLETGYPLAIMDATYTTALRTAAVGAIAVECLSRENSETIGFIGSGEQAMMHFKLIKQVRNIKKCYVSSRNWESERLFIDILQKDFPDVEFVDCKGDNCKASSTADIIVTAVSCQKPLLKYSCIKEGATYIHVGGWEDEYNVALGADKIICDEWESVKGRSQTLSRMYKEKLISDDDIYCDLIEILTGDKSGRETENEFIYFNSVGQGFIDIYLANYIYNFVDINSVYKIKG